MKVFEIFQRFETGNVWEVEAETFEEAIEKIENYDGEDTDDVILVDDHCDFQSNGYELLSNRDVV